MPNIEFAGQTIQCKPGDNLRRVLLAAQLPLYNGIAKTIHCRGLGSCGTCAIRIDGEVSPMTRIERWRLGFPPHSRCNGLRLACQCSVESDATLYKYPGLWGHQSELPPVY